MYSAIYLSGDLGTRFRVTSGHANLDSAKSAVERWCSQRANLDLDAGEVVVCRAGESTLQSVARFGDGGWSPADPGGGDAELDRERPVSF